MGHDIETFLPSIGVKKDKHLSALMPLVQSVVQAATDGDSKACMSALFALRWEFRTNIAFGGDSKFDSFVELLETKGALKPTINGLTVIRGHTKGLEMQFGMLSNAGMEEFIKGMVLIVSDEMLASSKGTFSYSSKTEFGVISEGTNTEQFVFGGQYLIGAWAVVLGRGVSIEKKGNDNRLCYFIAADDDWQVDIPIDSERTAQSEKLAMRLSKKVAHLGQPEQRPMPESIEKNDITEKLRALVDFHKEGVLSDEEFSLARARLLGL